MKALSIRNPEAYFVVSGLKDVENRTWPTKYRGKLAIHATGNMFAWPGLDFIPAEVVEQMQADVGKNFEELHGASRAYETLCRRAEIYLHFEDNKAHSEKEFDDQLKVSIRKYGYAFVNRAVIGHVDLYACVTDSSSPWAHPGQYHWCLRNAYLYDTPIIGVKGRLRLWDFNH